MRVALYSRCSTTDQHPEIQIERMRTYAELRELEVAGEFVDRGESGRKESRPALDAMMQQVRKREVDAVMIVKLDRLARSVKHLCTLAADLEAVHCALIVADQGISTDTASGRFLFNTLAAVAELEADLCRERTLAGIENARRRGVKFGRPERCDKRAKDRIKRLRHHGATIQRISEITGVSVGTTHRVLTAG